MIDSMFDRKLFKKFDSIAKDKAKLQHKENVACQEFMKTTSPDVMRDVFNIIEEFGHPKEQADARLIKNKYEAKEDLSLEDILTLDGLYKSCYYHMNKENCDE